MENPARGWLPAKRHQNALDLSRKEEIVCVEKEDHVAATVFKSGVQGRGLTFVFFANRYDLVAVTA